MISLTDEASALMMLVPVLAAVSLVVVDDEHLAHPVLERVVGGAPMLS